MEKNLGDKDQSKRKSFSSIIYNKNISCFIAFKLGKATGDKVRWHMDVGAFSECRKQSCSTQELAKGD